MKGKIYIFLTAMFIGMVLGYTWRMIQVEGAIRQEIQSVYARQQEIHREITRLEVGIRLLEIHTNYQIKKKR